MARDLRDVVNKIIVAVGDDEASSDDIAGLASDLATFFDASVTLVYVGRVPLNFATSESPVGHPNVAVAVNAIEEIGTKTLDRMADVLNAHGVPVTAKLILGGGDRTLSEIIEQEKCDLVVLPHWESGVTQRLIRVFSPSIIEQATCPVLILKGSKWLKESEAARPGIPEDPVT